MKKILIMGLPGSGKTTLANQLKSKFPDCLHLNGDEVRKTFNDWDFSYEGRIRQAYRMRDLSKDSTCEYVMIEFVCPLPEMRQVIDPDWIVWVDTIEKGRFEDTNRAFVPPEKYDFRITEQNAEKWSEYIVNRIINNIRRPTFDWRRETALLLGRYQPWHGGHRALFERAIAKTGQVVIQIRDCQGWNDSNPFNFQQVKAFITRDLDPHYQGQYEVILVPNIVNITYGRDVGYKIEQEVFDDSIHSISATNIRKSMGLK